MVAPDTLDAIMPYVLRDQHAVSRQEGRGRLALHASPELNALTASSAAQNSEEGRLDTLDACMRRFAWTDVAFKRMDAEDEEAHIIMHDLGFADDEIRRRLAPLAQRREQASRQTRLAPA